MHESVTSRRVDAVYCDPLDRIWSATAATLGITIARSDEVYAAYDGAFTLTLGTADTLDRDDSLAQMICHELCHAAVQLGAGVDAFATRDFGLTNRDDRDLPRERATLRVQATIASRHGLRRFLAPTTEHRAFYDALPEEPLAGAPRDEAAFARAAIDVLRRPPFAPHLDSALAATAAIVAIVRTFTADGPRTLYETGDAP
jgi:hypothetical protein